MVVEMVSYYVLGICIFYGMVNINQMLMEFMGLYLFGFSFVNFNMLLCDVLIVVVVQCVVVIIWLGNDYLFVGEVLDECVFVNGIVGLMVMGGLMNLIIYLFVMVWVVGVLLDFEDFYDLLESVLLMVWVYFNGLVDVNYFYVVGGLGYMIVKLLDVGFLYEDVCIIVGGGLGFYV